MGEPDEAAAFCGARAPGVLCLADPQRNAYRAYGLGLAGASQIFSPEVVIGGVQAALEGHSQGATMGEPRQMPGLFVVAPGGRLLLAHYSRTVADHGDTAAVRAALDAWRAGA